MGTNVWRLLEVTGDCLPGDRYGHGAVSLETGQILVVGGKTRYKDRLEVYVLDVVQPDNDNEELSISVSTKHLMPFEGRWGFAFAYDAKERILFLHGGFSATHNHGQTILFQINSISKCPVPVLVSNVQGPSPRGYHSAALSVDGERAIYVFGGQCCVGGPYEYYNDVYRFDLDTNCWEWIDTVTAVDEDKCHSGKPQRPHPRSQSFIFVKQGCLYVYGGYDGHSVLADMYKLDLTSRTWSLIWASKFSFGCGGSPVGVGGLRPVDFRIHPCRPAAVIVKDKLLVLSEDYENGTALLFSLDLKSFRWTRMASVDLKSNKRPTSLSSLGPPARGNPTMSLVKGHLLIIGGHNRNESRFPGLRQNHGQLGHVWSFRLPRRMDWARERVLWIACFKNSLDEGCHLSRCPPHIIYHIIGYVNSDTFKA